MNANTRLRLWKETRALLPMWAAVVGLMVVPYFMRANNPVSFSSAAYWLGCALLGAMIVGQEFQHRTFGLLLTQPISRRRLWWEKMAVLAAAQFSLLLLRIGLWFCEQENRYVFEHTQGITNLLRMASLSLPPIVGFCTGPVMTLLARGVIGGLALTFLCPWALWLAIGLPILWVGYVFDSHESFAKATSLVACLYSGGLLVLGCWRFQRLEDIQGRGAELTLPAALAKPFAEFTGRFTLGRGSALGQLVRKEVRLHLPAFVVALGLVALWLALVVAVFARATMDKGFLMLPIVLLCLGIPVIAGIVAVAEERSLGVHEWHLTLPVSARRQWCVKVLVALGVNVAFGILLPGLLAHASSWLVGGERLLEVKEGDVWAFLASNAVIFCAALYASSASANSMRALVGTIGLIVAGGTILTLSNSAASWFAKAIDYSPTPMRDGWWPAPEYLRWLQEMIWPWGVHGALLMLFAFGLENFRRTLDSLWRPVRHVVTLFAVISVLMAYASAWGILGVNYEGAYYELFRGRK